MSFLFKLFGKVFKFMLYMLATGIILGALLVSFASFLTPVLNSHRADFERLASQLLTRPVRIGQISVHWHALLPMLELDDVRITDPTTDETVFLLPVLRLRAAWLPSLMHHRLQLDAIEVANVSLTVHEPLNANVAAIKVMDLALPAVKDNLTGHTLQLAAIFHWLFAQPKLRLVNIYITIVQADGEKRDLILDQLQLNNSGERHVLTGSASMLTGQAAQINFVAHWQGAIGNVQLRAQHISLDFPKVFSQPLQASALNGDIQFEQLADGSWQLVTTAFVVENEDTHAVVNAKLILPPSLPLPLKQTLSPYIDLSADFNLLHAEHVQRYLPLKIFHPKLVKWLQAAFKSGYADHGHAILQGRLANFPFDKAPGKFSITGEVHDAELYMDADWPEIQHINGSVTFDGDTMQADATAGEISGVSFIEAHARIPSLSAHDNELNVTGKVATDLNHLLPFVMQTPLKPKLARYFTLLRPSGAMQLSLNLQLPLSTPAKTTVQGHMTTAQAKLDVSDAHLKVDQLQGSADFTQQGLTTLALTGQAFSQPVTLSLPINQHTVQMQGNVNVIDVARWLRWPQQKVLSGTTHYTVAVDLPTQGFIQQAVVSSDLRGVKINLPGQFAKAANIPAKFSLTLNAPLAANTQMLLNYNNFQVRMTDAATGMTFGVNNAMARGQVMWPTAAHQQAVQAVFQYLHLQPNTLAGTVNSVVKPTALPAVHFSCQDMMYGSTPLGRVTFELLPTNRGMTITQLTARSTFYQIDARGTWLENGTHIQGKVQTQHVDSVLAAWGDAPVNYTLSNGTLQFQFAWAGAPWAVNLKTVSGTANLVLGKGQVLHLDKETSAKVGWGRMLNILSLQSIPRRLSLDFSDVFAKGYSFDSLKGNFTLQNGSAFTQDAHLGSEVAHINIYGRFGLAAHDYDLRMDVTPHVTSSLPVVAALALSNPLIGVATWMVGKMVNPAVSKMTTYHYAITGGWDNPQWRKVGGSG